MTAAFVLLVVALIRTAWLSDDAYISFRVADNILNGFGPVWNAGERVQAFTHPLWLGLCTVVYAVAGNMYYSVIALSMVLTLLFAYWLSQLAIGPWQAAAAFAAMLSSKALIDFSSSGLENPLTHVVLLWFVIAWQRRSNPALLGLLAATLALNRLDLGLIAAPVLIASVWQQGWQRGPSVLRPLMAGLLPLVIWLAFATLYYGTPFPNTAYAKLSGGMTEGIRLGRGFDYLWRTLTGDPATLPVIAAGLTSAALTSLRRDWPLISGALLYLIYVVIIGGDFMMGRLFTPALVIAIVFLAQAQWLSVKRAGPAFAAAVLIAGLLAPWEPALLGGYGYAYADNWIHGRATREPGDHGQYAFVRQIMDERRNYYEFAGLLKVGLAGRPEHAWVQDGLMLRSGDKPVVVRGFIGLVGFYAGPGVHIIDQHALTDPLLARLPGGTATSVIGHLLREIPAGYVESVASGSNRLSDPNLAAYYTGLRSIVSGPVWSVDRFRILASFLAGGYEPYRQAYLASHPYDPPQKVMAESNQ